VYKSLVVASILAFATPAFAADVDTADKLLWARKTDEVIKFLKDHPNAITEVEAGMKYTLLHLAGMTGDAKVAAYLVEHGADINAKDADGYTPLVRAKANRNQAVVDILVKHGAK